MLVAFGNIFSGLFQGALGGLVSGIGSFFGAKSSADKSLQATRETNEQNYKIWQEQKEHNIEMFEMENQANIDMWNMQNEYNDPAQQAQRLIDAGYNPYLAIGNNAAGVATSSPQTASATPAQAPTMQAPDPSAFQSPLSAFVQSALQGWKGLSEVNLLEKQSQKTEAEAEGQETVNEYLSEQYEKFVEGLGLKNEGQRLHNAWQKTENQFQSLFRAAEYDITSTEAKIKRASEQTELAIKTETLNMMRAQQVDLGLDIQAKQIMNAALPAQQQISLMSSIYDLESKYLHNQITKKEYDFFYQIRVAPLLSQMAVNYAQARKLDSEADLNDIKLQIQESTLPQMKQAAMSAAIADMNEAELRNSKARYENLDYKDILDFNDVTKGFGRAPRAAKNIQNYLTQPYLEEADRIGGIVDRILPF